MSKHAQSSGRIPSRKIRRLVLVSAIVAVFALGATAAVSLRGNTGRAADTKPQPNSAEANQTGAPHSNLGSRAGGPAPFTPQTGQVTPLTQEQAQRLAADLKRLVNQSTEGLKEVHHADGSVSMDLQGRFQSVVVRKQNENGEWVVACVDSPEAAAAFFEIDPQLLGVKKSAATPKANLQPKGEVR